MPSTHAETRNIVFPENTARNGCCVHEQNKENGNNRIARDCRASADLIGVVSDRLTT
jgi:hypothetical protein